MSSYELSTGVATVIVGAQWGDEGKGKLIDLLSEKANVICRYNGGSNAGHTIVVDKVKHAFHLVPSGILYPDAVCFIGNGVVVCIETLLGELAGLEKSNIDYKDRFFISDRAHVVLGMHKTIDGLNEVERSSGTGKKLGTTKRGIGPCYADKMSRTGIRVGDLKFPELMKDKLERLVAGHSKRWAYTGDFNVDVAAELEKYQQLLKKIDHMIVDGVQYLHTAFKDNKRVLIEGANAAMLDIDFGTYPYVTSSNPISGGACAGLGIPPKFVGKVIGVVKAYSTRVGAGPFPTEDEGPAGTQFQKVGHEFGTTTGRPRRCGWIDLVQLKYSSQINGFDYICITKLDVLSNAPELKLCTKYMYEGKELQGMPGSIKVLEGVTAEYITMPAWTEDITGVRKFEDLPENAKNYVKKIESEMNVKVGWIGVGPGRAEVIECL